MTAFVLLLQEAYRRGDAVPSGVGAKLPVPSRIAGTGRGPDIEAIARAQRTALFYAPSMRNGGSDVDREDRGNAILSTLPLANPAAIELPFEHQRRVVVSAIVESPTPAGRGWRLRVVDVHLDTAITLFHGGPAAGRVRQTRALVDALEAQADANAATIVAGDFNSWLWREPALDVVRRAYGAGPPALRVPTFAGPLWFTATLDHVFARGVKHVAIERLPDRFGSDHYPLLAVVSF